MISSLKTGTRRTSAVTNVAGAASVLLYQVSNFANQIGTKSFKLRKLVIQNAAAGGLAVTLGTGAGGAYAALTPAFQAVNNIENIWTEAELPAVEWTADMYVQAPGWAAGALNVQVEVEEIG